MAGQTHPRMFVGKKRGLERLRCPELALHAGAGGGVGRCHARRCHLVPCRWCWRSRTGAGCTPRIPAPIPGRTRCVARERRQLSERNPGLISKSSSRRVALSLVSTQWDLSASSLTANPSTGLLPVSEQTPRAARGAQWDFTAAHTQAFWGKGYQRSEVCEYFLSSPSFPRLEQAAWEPSAARGVPGTGISGWVTGDLVHTAGFQVAQARIRMAS